MIYPNAISINPEDFEIEVCAYSSELHLKEIEFVLDLNQFREVVGLEIFNLKLELGNKCLNLIGKYINTIGKTRYSYDEESDSFYLQLSEENSLDQEVIVGEISLNSNKEILKFKAKQSNKK